MAEESPALIMEEEQPHRQPPHHHPHLHVHHHCVHHHLLHFHHCRCTPHIHFHCHHHRPYLPPLQSFGFPHRPPLFPSRSISEEPLVSAVDRPITTSEGFNLQKECNEGLELDDEDEEVEFVLTDEWREFFAKSEAKRRYDKQQKQKARNRK
ncbi:hypothetical protein J5N97_007268 [Dioscorea zingiberensis]|uniref:Uncharacterized protein n=1 Tax=Dioscorea zingiberensis TaxID=325984 RepID=A0A9D5DFH3_9LILI|nr:hypothetical protein J5N97_007268 [Dioscorea zingiberensis]